MSSLQGYFFAGGLPRLTALACCLAPLGLRFTRGFTNSATRQCPLADSLRESGAEATALYIVPA